MIVSIALHMGLHRDGEQFGLDAYETEMRRRVWSILVMIDGLNAAAYGRPMMISDTQFDTKPLAPLNDADLRPGVKVLPSYRDANIVTDTTYATAKYRLSIITRKIISSLFGIKPPSYDTILKLDVEVRREYDSIPDCLRYQAIQGSVPVHQASSVELAMQRIGLNILANHNLLILHRPFLYRSFGDTRYIPSREKCVEAAHQILKLFDDYRNAPQYREYSWNAIGALNAFHAGTVVALRCYLEPLTCSQGDWDAVEHIRAEFLKIAHGQSPGWTKLGEKGSKVFSILRQKALEKRAILGGPFGTKGAIIGPSPTVPAAPAPTDSGFSASRPLNFTSSMDGSSSSTGVTPQYSGQPLFGTTNQFDMNPLTNPGLQSDPFRTSSMLLGAGMPGVAATDSSPEQPDWDIFWPKGTNLVRPSSLLRYHAFVWFDSADLRVV